MCCSNNNSEPTQLPEIKYDKSIRLLIKTTVAAASILLPNRNVRIYNESTNISGEAVTKTEEVPVKYFFGLLMCKLELSTDTYPNAYTLHSVYIKFWDKVQSAQDCIPRINVGSLQEAQLVIEKLHEALISEADDYTIDTSK